MTTPVTISPTLLRQFLTCERRAWLDTYEDDALRDPLPRSLVYRLEAGVEHEEAVHQAAGKPAISVTVESWDEGVQATRELMQQGVEVITGAYLERWVTFGGERTNVLIKGRVDRLIKKRRSVRGSAYPLSRSVYQPVEIKRYDRIGLSDELQLDAYLWMLQEYQTEDVDGMFWLGERGEGIPRFRRTHELDELRLLKWVSALAKILVNPEAPPVRIEPHCKNCPWFSSCKTAVQPQLPISLLSGVSQQAREHLRASGVTSLNQIVQMHPDDLRRFRGIKSTAPAVHAHARSHVERQPIWFAPLPPASAEPGIMFDLETDPYTQKPWSWGWCDGAGNTQVILTARRAETVMLAENRAIYTVPDTDSAWRLFAELNASPLEKIYHWTAYDAGVMRASAPDDVRGRLEGRMYDLHRTYKSCVRFPVDGASLKVVARYLKYEWAEYDAWDAAYNDYRRWLSTGDLDALRRSCNYQQADVQALAVVWNWLVTHQS